MAASWLGLLNINLTVESLRFRAVRALEISGYPGKMNDIVLLKWKNRTRYKIKSLWATIELMLIKDKHFFKELGSLLILKLNSNDITNMKMI